MTDNTEHEALARVISQAVGGWNAETRAITNVADAIMASPVWQGRPAAQAEGPSVEEWATLVRAERARQAEKGYDAAHDQEHGVKHLLTWAIDYARRGEPVKSSALILAAVELLASHAEEES